jgi:hypothetical protein
MAEPRTAFTDDTTELGILWPHLVEALERDAGVPQGGRVSGAATELGLPVNADAMIALQAIAEGLPRIAAWAAGVVAEQPVTRTVDGHLRHLPRLHERMLVTAAAAEAGQLADAVHALLRTAKLAVGLRLPDRRLGQFCPLHDDVLTELIAPGDEGILRYRYLDHAGQPIAPAVEWQRHDAALCRHCRAAWTPDLYLLLRRLLAEADNRRIVGRVA